MQLILFQALKYYLFRNVDLKIVLKDIILKIVFSKINYVENIKLMISSFYQLCVCTKD